ncbi:MAG TPA: urease subunit gamma [Nitrososphaera sp.]|nr:urease subunit gamma [Nitrososphaera sp.]
MIYVKATVRGEPDAAAFTRVFDYDEAIFLSSAKVIEEKVQRSIKINAGEALIAYCAHVVKSIRAGKQDSNIQDEAQEILSVDKVMIGVPETLRMITFEAAIDSRPARKIVLEQPIPAGKYSMAG